MRMARAGEARILPKDWERMQSREGLPGSGWEYGIPNTARNPVVTPYSLLSPSSRPGGMIGRAGR